MHIDELLKHCEREEFPEEIILTAHEARYAQGLCKAPQEVAHWLSRQGLKRVLLYWDGCDGIPYEFDNRMAMSATDSQQPREDDPHYIIEQIVYCSELRLPLQLRQRLDMAAEDERPVSIIDRTSKKQIAINDPMVELLATPPEEATQRVMTGFWRSADLKILEQRYQQEGKFIWRGYQGGLNNVTWALLDAEFEQFEADGRIYGYVRNLDHDIIPMPADMQLQLANA